MDIIVLDEIQYNQYGGKNKNEKYDTCNYGSRNGKPLWTGNQAA